MKNVKLILVIFTVMLFFGMDNVSAQGKSTVIITTITTGKEIILQVVDDQNNTTYESLKFNKDKPEQAILKIEMDKWVKKGYEIKQSYGYAQSSLFFANGGQIISTRYETIILSKDE